MNKREAVIVVDYQNDFANQNGTLYVKGGELLLPYINKLMQEVKSRAGLIITSQDWHPENHISFAKTYGLKDFESLSGETKWPIHCVANTFGADYLEGFNKDIVDTKIFKGYLKDVDSFSSFGGNTLDKKINQNLDQVLKNNNIKILHIVGLATEYCDKATVIDALGLGYDVNLHTAGIAAVNINSQDGENAIEFMKNMGAKIL